MNHQDTSSQLMDNLRLESLESFRSLRSLEEETREDQEIMEETGEESERRTDKPRERIGELEN